MATQLAQLIQQIPLVDTHEHLRSEESYLTAGLDLLCNLFENYVPADLVGAGADPQAVTRLLDRTDPDVSGRFAGIQTAWQLVKQTGYGEAVRIIARDLYGLDELTPAGLEAAQTQHAALVQPGQRLAILRDRANLDHVQTDDFVRACHPDPAGPDFFFFDISWAPFCSGTPDLDPLAQETGVTVHDLPSLQRAMEAVFAQNGAVAIAVKSQHAYNRTLLWRERTEKEAAQALAAYLRDGEQISEADRLCLGDWCWARGVELAIEHDLPFKLHTGYYAGHSRMPVDRIKSGNLCALLARYPDARFVLMHIAYPYSHELIALAKHYPNVYADLCWAWSIDPFSAADFVRRFVHAVPANKLFAFGGDTSWPGAAYAYAVQARTWLTRALEAEVMEGLLSEADAMAFARRIMRENQYDCFRVEEKKKTVLGIYGGNGV